MNKQEVKQIEVHSDVLTQMANAVAATPLKTIKTRIRGAILKCESMEELRQVLLREADLQNLVAEHKSEELVYPSLTDDKVIALKEQV